LGDRIVLFYEEPEYARILNFRYIRNGLTNGEQCIYLVFQDVKDRWQSNNDTRRGKKINNNDKEVDDEENDNNQTTEFIKQDMVDNDIDVSRYLSEDSLHIGSITNQQLFYYYKNHNLRRNENELFKSMLPNSFMKLDKYSRLMSTSPWRLVLDLGLESHMNYDMLPYILELEESYHSVFHGLRGSSICNYPVQDIESTLTDYSDFGRLVTIRLNTHNGVIFARKFGKGIALTLE